MVIVWVNMGSVCCHHDELITRGQSVYDKRLVGRSKATSSKLMMQYFFAFFVFSKLFSNSEKNMDPILNFRKRFSFEKFYYVTW